MYLGDKESFKIGDIVSNDKHDNMTVINVFDSEKDTVSCWSKLLGENYITSTDRDAKDIVDIIPELVLRSYNSETPEIELGD